MPPSSDTLSTKEILDRQDAATERATRERAAMGAQFDASLRAVSAQFDASLRRIQVENRYLVLVLIAIVAALAGVQVSLTPEGIETRPAQVEVSAAVVDRESEAHDPAGTAP